MITNEINQVEKELTTTINNLNKTIAENNGLGQDIEREHLRTIRNSIIESYCLIQEMKLKGMI